MKFPDHVTFTADDEEPKCERCNRITADEKYCSEMCGPEHWWHGYKRTITLDDMLQSVRRMLKND